ncbi:MAG: sulfur transferase domain-containing protein [Pseudomonadota bacterium]
MASLAKRAKRAVRGVTMAWRHGLIARAPDWARRRFGPTAGYLDMLLVDHGILRFAYLNKHKLADDAWRCAQPAPHQIRAMARQGVRTIINLRGERVCGSYWWERRACEDAGIKLVNFAVGSRAAPTRDELYRAKALFETVEYPIVMHCKSGADRAGLMSVLYRHMREGWPIEKAMQELSLKYGHIKQADTGVLDRVFECYLRDTATTPMTFFHWVDTVYDPDAVKERFRANGMANRMVNSILRRE